MLLFVDGCSHYDDAFLGEKWDYRDTTGLSQSRTGGRFGAGRIIFGSLGAGQKQHLSKTYNGVSTIICGFALKQTATQSATGGQLLHFMDGNTIQVGIRILQSGQLRIFRGLTIDGGVDELDGSGARFVGVTIGESTQSISSSAHDFMEVKVIHHPTTGSVEIKRNGSAFYTLNNVNTAFSGVNQSAAIIWGSQEPAVNLSGRQSETLCEIGDVYLVNTIANPSDALDPVDFIGDRHWEPITPTADGADTAWTVTGSASHFANVDEVPPNTSDFNSTPTLNARDGFVVSSPTGPSAASVLLALTMYCQKNNGGSNALKGFARSSGGSYRNGTEFQVPSPWAFRQSFLASKPGGGAITIADVASHQWGYEKTV